MRVVIGLCHGGDIKAQFLGSFLDMEKPEDWYYTQTIRMPTPMARCAVVQTALQDPAVSHIFFMDDDMLFPRNALLKLLAADAPIVSGFYVKRAHPFYPIAARRFQDHYVTMVQFCPGLQEVDVVGGGCLLVKREVFEKLPYPWFTYHSDYSHRETTEDVVFCEHAKDAGYPILLDFDVQCSHLGELVAGFEHWKMASDGRIETDTPEGIAAHEVRPWIQTGVQKETKQSWHGTVVPRTTTRRKRTAKRAS